MLLTAEHVAKISDVGLAWIQTQDDSAFEFSHGTFAYAAPELILGLKCTEKVLPILTSRLSVQLLCRRSEPGHFNTVWSKDARPEPLKVS